MRPSHRARILRLRAKCFTMCRRISNLIGTCIATGHSRERHTVERPSDRDGGAGALRWSARYLGRAASAVLRGRGPGQERDCGGLFGVLGLVLGQRRRTECSVVKVSGAGWSASLRKKCRFLATHFYTTTALLTRGLVVQPDRSALRTAPKSRSSHRCCGYPMAPLLQACFKLSAVGVGLRSAEARSALQLSGFLGRTGDRHRKELEERPLVAGAPSVTDGSRHTRGWGDALGQSHDGALAKRSQGPTGGTASVVV